MLVLRKGYRAIMKTLLKYKNIILWLILFFLCVPALYWAVFGKSISISDCNRRAREAADKTDTSKLYKTAVENTPVYKMRYDFFYSSCMRMKGYEK